MQITPSTALLERASNACELCTGTEDLRAYEVPRAPEPGDEATVVLCALCTSGVEGEAVDDKHWFCLQESAWSEVAAVQVTAWRLLKRNTEGWAQDLFGQLWLPEEVLAWADLGEEEAGEEEVGFIDCNGVPLKAGDNATITKDLPVKGGGFVAKRGTMVRGIRLTNDPTHIEASVNKVTIWIKTCFLKKA